MAVDSWTQDSEDKASLSRCSFVDTVSESSVASSPLLQMRTSRSLDGTASPEHADPKTSKCDPGGGWKTARVQVLRKQTKLTGLTRQTAQ